MKSFGSLRTYGFVVRKEIISILFVICVTAAGCIGIFHLWEVDLSVMFYNQEDSIGLATLAEDYISGIPRSELSLMPYEDAGQIGIMSAFTHRLILRLICIFCSSFGMACNLLYLLGYILVAVSMYIILRKMNVHYAIACVLCEIYTFLPYHYLRGESHIYLGMYYLVPFACWMILDFLEVRGKLSKKRFCIFLFIAVIMALTDIYYTVFTCILFVLAGIVKSAWEKDMHYVQIGFLLCSIMLITIAVSNTPYIFMLVNGGQLETSISNRSLRDLEVYGLRLSQLLLPIQEHRINAFRLLRSYYDESIVDTESKMTSLGLIMSGGFLFSLFSFLVYRGNREIGICLKNLGLLNLCSVLIATVGGVNIFIGFFSPVIRCYNRMSVFIATFSIIAAAIMIQAIYENINKINWKKYLFYIGLVLLLVIGIFDQTPSFDRNKYQENFGLDKNIRDMVNKIENSVPDGSMIFMLPLLYENEDSEIYHMRAYEQNWPALYSDTLRWSATKSIGLKDQNRQWKKALSVMDMQEMLENISVTGFAGVWLDENGCDETEFSRMQSELESYLGKPLCISASGKQYYYSMDDFNIRMKQKYTSGELEQLKSASIALGQQQGDYYAADRLSFQGEVSSGKNDSKILKKESIQYGPYINLEKGSYQLEIYGSGISEDMFSVTANQGMEKLEYTVMHADENHMFVTFTLNQAIDNVEFVLQNEADKDIELRYYYLTKVERKD